MSGAERLASHIASGSSTSRTFPARARRSERAEAAGIAWLEAIDWLMACAYAIRRMPARAFSQPVRVVVDQKAQKMSRKAPATENS